MRARLARCEKLSWTMVSRLIGAENRAAPAPRAGAIPAAAPRPSDDELLCDVARQNMVEHWKTNRAGILANLRKSLDDDQEQEGNLRRDLERLERVALLAPHERADLETEYRVLRARVRTQVRALLDQTPPDLEAAHRHVKDYFADEDAMVERRLGPEARAAWAEGSRRYRTVLLAMIATLAAQRE